MTVRLELEVGTDVLLLETGDALLLELSVLHVPYHDFVYIEDASKVVNRVTVVGDGGGIVRIRTDAASYAKFGEYYDAKIVDDNIDTNDWADAVGDAFLTEFANEKISGRTTINQEGLVVGQRTRIADAYRAVDDDFLIQGLSLRILGGEKEVVVVQFGDFKPELADLLRRIQTLQQVE